MVNVINRSAAVAAVYGYALMHGAEPEARAMAFATIIFGNLGLILASRSRTRPILEKLNPRVSRIYSANYIAMRFWIVLAFPGWHVTITPGAARCVRSGQVSGRG